MESSSVHPEESRVLLVWGDTQVGKTALLTVAFNGSFDSELVAAGLDVARSVESIHQAYGHSWRALRENQPTAATAQVNDTEIVLANGRAILLRDIRGGDVRRDHEPAIMSRLYQGADVALFLVDPTAATLGRQFAQVSAPLRLFSQRPRGLVFTKCELLLEEYHSAWNADRDWWRAVPRLAPHEALIGQFGPAVWPTSAFGYHDGHPAVILGEFGELLPYQINPKGVLEPFKWMFQQLRG